MVDIEFNFSISSFLSRLITWWINDDDFHRILMRWINDSDDPFSSPTPRKRKFSVSTKF